jgi:exopolysaccharide biosynthesis operon protein EpsL
LKQDDRHRRRQFATLVIALVATLHAGRAMALSGDRISPYVGLGYTYTDNLFFLDERRINAQNPILEGGQASDMFLAGRVGLRASYPISRQIINLRGEISRNAYQTYNRLDHNAYNFGADVDWDYGRNWDGKVGANERVALGAFADQRLGLGNERNLRTFRNIFANANYALTPDTKVRTAINLFNLENSANAFNAGNRQDTSYDVGLRSFSKGRDDFLGINFNYTDGKFPDREEVAPGSFIDNSYKQYRISGDVDYTFSGLTRVEVDWGYTSRQHDVLPQRNFGGLTGRLTVRYGLSRRTSFNGSVFRELGAFDDVTTTYIVTTGISGGVSHEITPKLSAQAQYSLRNRRFTGDPGFVIAQRPARDEDIQSLSLGLTWQAERNLRVNANYSYNTRSANLQFFDFAVNTFTVGAQLSF